MGGLVLHYGYGSLLRLSTFYATLYYITDPG